MRGWIGRGGGGRLWRKPCRRRWWGGGIRYGWRGRYVGVRVMEEKTDDS